MLFSLSVMSDSLQCYGLQQAKLSCPPQSPGVWSSSRPLSWGCYLTIPSSGTLFTFCLQSFPISGSFPMTQFFASGGQSIGASGSNNPSNEKSGLISFRIGWFDLLAVQGALRIFSNSNFQKHQFFGTQPSLWSNSHICT